jgi:ribonuclease VapC
MSKVVLDTSALLALLLKEPGAEVVKARGRGGLLSTVSYSEAIAKSLDRNSPLEVVRSVLDGLQLTMIAFDDEHALRAASFRPATRNYDFFFADRACLATGSLAGLPVLAADRKWRNIDLGVEVVLIRHVQ